LVFGSQNAQTAAIIPIRLYSYLTMPFLCTAALETLHIIARLLNIKRDISYDLCAGSTHTLH
jgi:hypothetical protein